MRTNRQLQRMGQILILRIPDKGMMWITLYEELLPEFFICAADCVLQLSWLDTTL